MTEHLPECLQVCAAQDALPEDECLICTAIRAFEKRVEEKFSRDQFDAAFSAGYKAGYPAGYTKAVADAQWLLEEHVDSIGWVALAKMRPDD